MSRRAKLALLLTALVLAGFAAYGTWVYVENLLYL
jgi:hypothetical protein